MKAQEVLKIISRYVTEPGSEVETRQWGNERLKRTTKEMIGQCFLSAKPRFKFWKYADGKVFHQLKAFALTFPRSRSTEPHGKQHTFNNLLLQ